MCRDHMLYSGSPDLQCSQSKFKLDNIGVRGRAGYSGHEVTKTGSGLYWNLGSGQGFKIIMFDGRYHNRPGYEYTFSCRWYNRTVPVSYLLTLKTQLEYHVGSWEWKLLII